MKTLLVCDLDNTLYDWVGYFVPSFYAMVEEAVSIMRCDRETLLDDFKLVHQRHHDSEHPFALLETATVARRYPNMDKQELGVVFDSAFHAFNSERKRSLNLYEGVLDTLDKLRARDVTLVAHTEGKLYSVLDRLRRMELLPYFSKIYCRERSHGAHPRSDFGQNWLGDFPMKMVTELSVHQRKPDPDILLEICKKEGVSLQDSFYVGDSMARDMLMAKSVGVNAIWAKYGTRQTVEDYASLVRITHWTDEDVQREAMLKKQAQEVKPDLILEKSFEQILKYIT